MAVYEDLSPYVYDEIDGGGPAVNVGWLGVESGYRVGRTSREFLEKLAEHVAENSVNVYRGFHECEFCDLESPVYFDGFGSGRAKVVLGHAEIRISRAGVVFVAPTLVVHYVEAHGYRPPDEFTTAVLESEV